MALRRGADAICEKPSSVKSLELRCITKKWRKNLADHVWNILQLRLHKSIIASKS